MSFKLIPKVFAIERPSPCGAGEGGGIDLGDCLRLSDSQPVSEIYDTPATLINLLVRNMFAVAGIVLFVMLFVAGFKFITKGKDGMEDAKKIITATITGFIIMFSAYWIVQIISLLTGVDVPGITIGSPS